MVVLGGGGVLMSEVTLYPITRPPGRRSPLDEAVRERAFYRRSYVSAYVGSSKNLKDLKVNGSPLGRL